jgi:hypothetical protein
MSAAWPARASACRRVSWPSWWSKYHHQTRAMNPQSFGDSRIQSGQRGGGSGASMRIVSRAKLRRPCASA